MNTSPKSQLPLFALSAAAIDVASLRTQMCLPESGALATFEGWVRNHHAGQAVTGLTYSAHPVLALNEGERVLQMALVEFEIQGALCVHRTGALEIGEIAVWVGITAAHRDAAFAACRYVIDRIKLEVPIWKLERYPEQTPRWLHPPPQS